jgi:hypothetical protein
LVRDHLPHFTVVRHGKLQGEVEVAEYPERPLAPGNELSWNFEVTHAVADLRVALEFRAYDAFARSSGDGAPGWLNAGFPICLSNQKFEAHVRTRFPKLKEVYPRVVDAFETVQRFRSPDNWWLEDLNGLWNECKHRNLDYFTQEAYVAQVGDSNQLAPQQVVRAIRFSRTNRHLLHFFEVNTSGVAAVIHALRSTLYNV